jgi:hypothetical protein
LKEIFQNPDILEIAEILERRLMLMNRAETLKAFFDNVEEDKKQFALDTVDEYIFFLDRIAELRKLPYIRVDKKNPERQMLTPAAKLIREYSQAVDAKRKTLLMILYRVENTAADELLAVLKNFE